jgi:hypothetical protein
MSENYRVLSICIQNLQKWLIYDTKNAFFIKICVVYQKKTVFYADVKFVEIPKKYKIEAPTVKFISEFSEGCIVHTLE